MTMTPAKGQRAVTPDEVMDEVIAEEVIEVAGQVPHVEDPIFWGVVADYGYPELSHPIEVTIRVYEPKKES